MSSTRRTEITLKTTEVIVIRGLPLGMTKRCSECTGLSWMISPIEAAALTGRSSREIYRLIEDGKLHFMEPEPGFMFVCLKSLEAATDRHGNDALVAR